MPLDVLRRPPQEDRIVLQTAKARIARSAQQIANPPADVVMVDVEGTPPGRPAADRAETILRSELGPINLKGNAIQPLAKCVSLALANAAHTRSIFPTDIPMRVRFIERMPTLAVRLLAPPVLRHSDRRSRLSASSKCFLSSLEVIRV